MQDYKIVQRALTGGATILDANGNMVSQNFSEFMSYLNEQYLRQGYTIHSIDVLKYTPPEGPNPPVSEVMYHLIKEVSDK